MICGFPGSKTRSEHPSTAIWSVRVDQLLPELREFQRPPSGVAAHIELEEPGSNRSTFTRPTFPPEGSPKGPRGIQVLDNIPGLSGLNGVLREVCCCLYC